MPQHGVFLFLFIGGVAGANRTVPDPAYLHQNKIPMLCIGIFVLRQAKLIEPPAGRSTASVFRSADEEFTLSMAKNTVQIPLISTNENENASCLSTAYFYFYSSVVLPERTARFRDRGHTPIFLDNRDLMIYNQKQIEVYNEGRMDLEKTAERRRELQCRIYPLNTLSPYKYVVVCSRYEGKWLMSRHKKRTTWETQGGHIEPGETPEVAARRELYEESGAEDAILYPVCDYYGYDSLSHSNGVVFLANIRHLGDLPQSEMKEVRLFQELPADLTYPDVSPRLYAEAGRLLTELGIE